MTDKEKIIEYIDKLLEKYPKNYFLLMVAEFADSLPEEPVKIKKGCKYRCLSDMVNQDTGNISFFGDKIYLAPEDNTLVSEENGWRCDTSENASNFELVDEPVSEDLEDAALVYSATDIITEEGKLVINSEKVNAFKAGAMWQKEQMMKEVVNAISCSILGKEIIYTELPKGIEIGDKVKVIIIKDE